MFDEMRALPNAIDIATASRMLDYAEDHDAAAVLYTVWDECVARIRPPASIPPLASAV